MPLADLLRTRHDHRVGGDAQNSADRHTQAELLAAARAAVCAPVHDTACCQPSERDAQADAVAQVLRPLFPAHPSCPSAACGDSCAACAWQWPVDAGSGSYRSVPSAAGLEPKIRHAVVIVAALLATTLLAFNALLAIVCGLLCLQALLRWAAVLDRNSRPSGHGAPDPREWPRYTVLVPLHDEAASVPPLMRALSRLDYPRDRLEILMVCEAHDAPTVAAVQAHLRAPFRLVVVPDIGPRTKPKALRYAMRGAFGDLVTIYDAEDAPHPDQLKAAARAFAADPLLVAVQAPLNVDNSAPGWVTRQFALEYASLFHVWVPFLARLGWPLPLGGTSNHIRRKALEAAGGWDGHNVTEDADLSLRLALGRRPNGSPARIGWIAPPTREEAVADWKAWKNQRSRWMKGFAQTWALHIRKPLAPGGTAGLKRFATLNLAVGLTVLTGLLHGPALVLVGVGAALGFVPSPLLCVVALALYASGLASIVVGARRAGVSLRASDFAGVPFYWMMMFVPAWAGVCELWTRPHHWNLTTHGVSERHRAEPPALPPPCPEPSYPCIPNTPSSGKSASAWSPAE